MYGRPRGRGGRGRGGRARGAGRGRRPNNQVTTAKQLPQRHNSFPSDSMPQNAGFDGNSPRHDPYPSEYATPNVGFSRSPPQQESFPSDPALTTVGYGRDPPQRDPFPSDLTPSNVGFGRNPPQHEPFPSDSIPSSAGFDRNLPQHDHFARDSTPPNVGFCHSAPWDGSVSSDPTSGSSPQHDSFIIDTTPLKIDFGGGSSGSSTAFPPAAHPLSPEFMKERAAPEQTSWQDFEKEELSRGGILGKHKQIPSPSSEKGSTEDKQLRLDTEVQGQEQEGLADSVGTSTSTSKDQVDVPREKDEDQGGKGSKDGDPGGKRSKVKKGSDVPKPPQLSIEDLTAVNKKVLMVEGSITHDQYFCSLCHAQLNCKRSLEKHMHSTEHIRRIVNLNSTKAFPYYCEVCCCGCPHKDVYDQHLQGKKHLRNMSLSSRNKGDRMPMRPLGDLLDELFKEEVAQVGDGLSLGMSTHMMRFFSMPGPFIGMQYAEEIGLPDDPNPQYTCTLCSVSVDAANHHLHFTSAAHRLAVLRTDHPEKYSELMQLELKKSVFNEKVKAIALEIESKEGRKVELIKRKILKPQSSSEGKFSGGQGRFSSGFSSRQGHHLSPGASSFRGRGAGFSSSLQGRGGSFVRGRGIGRGPGQLQPYGGHFSQRPSDVPYQSGGFVRGRGTDERRARGRGGRGGGRYFDPDTTDKPLEGFMNFSNDPPSQKWSQHQTQMDISAAVVRRRYGPGPGPQQGHSVTPSARVAPHFVAPTVAPPLQAQQTPPQWINIQSPPQAPPNWIQQQQAPPSWPQQQPVQPQQQQAPPSWPQQQPVQPQQQQALPSWPQQQPTQPSMIQQQPAQPSMIQQQQALPPSWPQPQPAQVPFIQQQQRTPSSWPQPQPAQLQQQQAPPHLTPSSWAQPQQALPQSWGSPATSTAIPQTFHHAGASPGAKTSGGALVSPSPEVSSQQAQPYQAEQSLDLQTQQGKEDAQLEVLLKSIHEQGASQDVVQQLAKINSEEDADAALKLSSALTQALLAYRIKSVSTSIPENPLAAVIGSLQGLSQLNFQNPTSSSNE